MDVCTSTGARSGWGGAPPPRPLHPQGATRHAPTMAKGLAGPVPRARPLLTSALPVGVPVLPLGTQELGGDPGQLAEAAVWWAAPGLTQGLLGSRTRATGRCFSARRRAPLGLQAAGPSRLASFASVLCSFSGWLPLRGGRDQGASAVSKSAPGSTCSPLAPDTGPLRCQAGPPLEQARGAGGWGPRGCSENRWGGTGSWDLQLMETETEPGL